MVSPAITKRPLSEPIAALSEDQCVAFEPGENGAISVRFACSFGGIDFTRITPSVSHLPGSCRTRVSPSTLVTVPPPSPYSPAARHTPSRKRNECPATRQLTGRPAGRRDTQGDRDGGGGSAHRLIRDRLRATSGSTPRSASETLNPRDTIAPSDST